MNFQKETLSMFFPLLALIASYASCAAADPSLSAGTKSEVARSAEKTLKIEVAPSFGTFKLSVSAPLDGNEASLRLEVGDDILDYIAEEQLSDVRVEFKILLADGGITRRSMIVAPNAPQVAVVKLLDSDFIVSVNASLRTNGDSQIVRPLSIRVSDPFQTVAQCIGIKIEQDTIHPEIRRLILTDWIAESLGLGQQTTTISGLDREMTRKVLSGDHFFATHLSDSNRLEVIRENSSLKLRKGDFLGNRMFDYYVFDDGCSF